VIGGIICFWVMFRLMYLNIGRLSSAQVMGQGRELDHEGK
jgi:hypothetical protein